MKPALQKLFFISTLILLLHFTLNLWTASGSEFHQDEYQHVHIAWNTLSGKKIYQDFFETHGPLSAWTFSSLLKLKGEPIASPESILFLRKITVSAVFFSGLLMFICLKLFISDLTLSLLATALFLGGITMQVTAFRIRPDIFVQLFFILSLILWKKRYRFLCGISLGIALGFNPKFLPLNLTLLIADLFISHLLLKNKKQLFALFSGELLVLGTIGLVLQSLGILEPALDGLFWHNFRASLERLNTTYYPFQLFKCFLELDKTLLLCSFAGTLTLGFLIWKKRFSLDENLKMLSALALCSLALLAAPLWHHSLLLTIPIFILVITYVAQKISSDSIVTEGVFWVIVLFTAYTGYRELPKYNGNLNPNFESLKKVLTETERSQPIFYIWPSRCPAYVFNSDDEKYWVHDTTIPKTQEGKWVNRFIDPKVKWVAIDELQMRGINPDEKKTLQEAFQQFGCVWKRK